MLEIIRKRTAHFALGFFKPFNVSSLIWMRVKEELWIGLSIDRIGTTTTINIRIAKARNPFKMAEAMKLSVIAGRYSYKAGRIKEITYGRRSTSNKGII